MPTNPEPSDLIERLDAIEESLSRQVDILFESGQRDVGMIVSQASASIGHLREQCGQRVSAPEQAELIERALSLADCDARTGEPLGKCLRECAHAITDLSNKVELLEDHIREQISFVETRIEDGIKRGASIWRIALEDVARENRAALAQGQASGDAA